MAKCYEMIKLSVLFEIFRQVGFPLRLGWMLIQCYIAPRRVDAFGSLSEAYISFQGILAGCSHACAMMLAVLLAPVRETIRRFPAVKVRALMDDVSLQWEGPVASGADVVFRAVRELCRRVAPIGLLLQPNKSGYLANSIAAEKRFRKYSECCPMDV